MCKSVAEGGQRCAAHTRERLSSRSAALQAAIASGEEAKAAEARAEWETAAAQYASTDEGHAYLTDAAQQADSTGDPDTAAMLRTLVRKGEDIRAANRDTSALLAAARLTAHPVAGFTAPTGPPPETGSDIVLPDAPTMEWITDKHRERWAAYEAAFNDLTPHADRFLSSYGGPNGAPDDVLAAWRQQIETVTDPSATDEELAKTTLSGLYVSQTFPPQWAKQPHKGMWESGTNVAEVRAAEQEWSKTQWAAFNRAGEAADLARRAHLEALLNHPNSGPKVFRKLSGGTVMNDENWEAVSAHPKCPADVLATIIRSNSATGHHVHPAGLARARTERFDNPSLALSLAAEDPDAFERAEAFNQVMITPIESFTEQDRMWLAAHFDRMPGGVENHITLAQSMKSWALGYGDAEERRNLGSTLLTSTEPRISAYGRELLGKPDESEPEKKRGWFGRD